MNWISGFLIVLALLIEAGAMVFDRRSQSRDVDTGFVIGALVHGMALCLCIQAGREWS